PRFPPPSLALIRPGNPARADYAFLPLSPGRRHGDHRARAELAGRERRGGGLLPDAPGGAGPPPSWVPRTGPVPTRALSRPWPTWRTNSTGTATTSAPTSLSRTTTASWPGPPSACRAARRSTAGPRGWRHDHNPERGGQAREAGQVGPGAGEGEGD